MTDQRKTPSDPRRMNKHELRDAVQAGKVTHEAAADELLRRLLVQIEENELRRQFDGL